MEKREENPLHEVPGSEARLTDGQLAAITPLSRRLRAIFQP